MTIDTLPGNFLVRIPTMEDVEAVFELINACDVATDGMPDHTLDEVCAYWQSSEFNLATDAWMVVTPGGQLVGYADIDHEGYGKMFSFIRVLPEYRKHGIETHLLELVEARAVQRIAEV